MLALDPNERFTVTLDSEAHLPEDERTRFEFRYLTARQFVLVCDLGDDKESMVKMSTAEAVAKLVEAIKINYCGAVNLWDLTVSELWELYYAARRQSRLSVTEKNVSASPLPRDTAPSAVADSAAPGDAATPPA